jgi:hypothetical protein
MLNENVLYCSHAGVAESVDAIVLFLYAIVLFLLFLFWRDQWMSVNWLQMPVEGLEPSSPYGQLFLRH